MVIGKKEFVSAIPRETVIKMEITSVSKRITNKSRYETMNKVHIRMLNKGENQYPKLDVEHAIC